MKIKINDLYFICSGKEQFLYLPFSHRRFYERLFSDRFFITLLSMFKKQPSIELDYLIKTLKNQFPSFEKNIQATIDHLLNEKILYVDDNRFSERKTFQSYGWEEVFNFHQHVRTMPALNYSKNGEETDVKKMKEYCRRETLPSNYKKIEYSSKIPLEKNLDFDIQNMSLKDLWTKNPVDGNTLNFGDLSKFIYLVFGQTNSTDLKVTGSHVGKTSPSGGSRHPIEAYILTQRIDGIPDALYHYNVEKNELHEFGSEKEKIDIDHLGDYSGHKFEGTFAAVFLTCIFERSMFRYRESRSYRVMNYDVGHLMQTASLVADSMKLNLFRTYDPNEDRYSDYLGIDKLNEALMSAMVLESGSKSNYE